MVEKFEAVLVAVVAGLLGFFVLSKTISNIFTLSVKLPYTPGQILSVVFAVIIAGAVYHSMVSEKPGKRRS